MEEREGVCGGEGGGGGGHWIGRGLRTYSWCWRRDIVADTARGMSWEVGGHISEVEGGYHERERGAIWRRGGGGGRIERRRRRG